MPPRKSRAAVLSKPIPISYSSAKLFESCPARFKAEKIDKVPVNRPIHLLVGVFLHDVLDEYLKHLKATGQPSYYAGYEEIFENMWKRGGRHGIPEDMHGELLDLVYKTREVVVIHDPKELVGSEIQIALDNQWNKTEWLANNAWLRMKIDRLQVDADWNVLVWDYKTGHKIDDVEKSKQLHLYGAGVKALFPQAKDIKVELYYCRTGVSKEYVVTEADIYEAKRWITAVSGRIEAARNGEFVATPGNTCGDCPIFEHCPARAMAASTIPPVDEHAAQALVSRLILVEQEAKGIKERLKPWCETNGPVVYNDMQAGFWTKTVRDFPIPDLVKWADGHGVPILGIVKADNDAIKKMAKGEADMQKELDAIAVDRTHSEFKLKKAGA